MRPRSVVPSIVAAVLACATAVVGQVGDARVRWIAPDSDTSFLSVTGEGVVRRHGASGEVLETLGRAAPFQGRSMHRVQAVAGGALVASSDLVRVSGGTSQVVLDAATLSAQRIGIDDVAFEPDGHRGVVAALADPPTIVLAAVEDGVVRRLPELPASASVGSVHVAIDARARWIAVERRSAYAMDAMHVDGFPSSLVVVDFATGAVLWEVARCDTPLTPADTLHFAGDVLVACRARTTARVWSGGLSGYRAASGRVQWSHELAGVFARATSGAVLVQVMGDEHVGRLDPATGRIRAAGPSWTTAPFDGVLLANGIAAAVLTRPDGPDLFAGAIARAPWTSAP